MEVSQEDKAIMDMLEEYNNKLYGNFIRLFSEALKNSDNVCMLFDVKLYEFFNDAVKESNSNYFGNDYEYFHIFKNTMHKFYSYVAEQAAKLDDDVVF